MKNLCRSHLWLLITFFIIDSSYCIAGVPLKLFTDKSFQFLGESCNRPLKVTYYPDRQGWCKIFDQKLEKEWPSGNDCTRIVAQFDQLRDKDMRKMEQVNWCELLSVAAVYTTLKPEEKTYLPYMVLSFSSEDFLLGCLSGSSFKILSVTDLKAGFGNYLKVTVKEHDAAGIPDPCHLVYILLDKNYDGLEFKGMWLYKKDGGYQNKKMVKGIQKEDIPEELLKCL